MARKSNAEYQGSICDELGIPAKDRERVMKHMWQYLRLVDSASAKGDRAGVVHAWQLIANEADRDVQFAKLMVEVQDHPQYWVTMRRVARKDTNIIILEVIDEEEDGMLRIRQEGVTENVKMQLVHPDFTRAKKSTSKEEYREAFFAYMQREDC